MDLPNVFESNGLTWVVTRHAGALDWISRQGLKVDHVVEHLDPQEVRHGDCVIGTLPVNLAAEVCERGGSYFHLSIRVPRDLRGRELSADQMQKLSVSLERFHVERPGR